MKIYTPKTSNVSFLPGFLTGFAKNVLIVTIFVTAFSGCQEKVAGPEGPAGQDGNANVIILNRVNQSIFYNPLVEVWEVILQVDEITPEIMSNGMVSVFLGPANSSNSSWTAIPGMFSPDISVIEAVHFNNQIFPASLVIYSLSEPAFKTVDVRVVIIEGN